MLLLLVYLAAGVASYDPAHPLYLEAETKKLQDMVSSSELLIRMTVLSPQYRDQISQSIYSFPQEGNPVDSFFEKLKTTSYLLFTSVSGDDFKSEKVEFVFSQNLNLHLEKKSSAKFENEAFKDKVNKFQDRQQASREQEQEQLAQDEIKNPEQIYVFECEDWFGSNRDECEEFMVYLNKKERNLYLLKDGKELTALSQEEIRIKTEFTEIILSYLRSKLDVSIMLQKFENSKTCTSLGGKFPLNIFLSLQNFLKVRGLLGRLETEIEILLEIISQGRNLYVQRLKAEIKENLEQIMRLINEEDHIFEMAAALHSSKECNYVCKVKRFVVPVILLVVMVGFLVLLFFRKSQKFLKTVSRKFV